MCMSFRNEGLSTMSSISHFRDVNRKTNHALHVVYGYMYIALDVPAFLFVEIYQRF